MNSDNQGYKAIPVFDWKGMVINAAQEFLKDTSLTEVQVNAWFIKLGEEPKCVDHGTLIQDHYWYMIQSGGRYFFDSIKVWIPKDSRMEEPIQLFIEPFLDQLARRLYPDSDEVHIKKLYS